MADTVPHADSNIVDAIVERLYQADMDVHFAFSLVRDERIAELFSQVIDRLEGLIRLVQDAVAQGWPISLPGIAATAPENPPAD
jgi:hypothetical protein